MPNKLTVRHSIYVNHEDDENTLTLEQLWEGLMLKLVQPQRFDHQVEHCHIQWLNDRQFVREQQYSELKVEDKVTLTPHSAVSVQSLVSGHEAFGLSINIEVKLGQQLIVHYEYQRSSANQDGLDVDDYLAEAYRQADEAALEHIKALYLQHK